MKKSRSSTSDALTKRRVRAVTMTLVGGTFEPGDHFMLMDPSSSSLGTFKVGVTGVIVTAFSPEWPDTTTRRYLVHFDDPTLNPGRVHGSGEPFEGKRYYWVREPDIKFICEEDK